jgi:hypothetical protein
MARKQSITRTIIENKVIFICLDEKEEKVILITVTINGNYTDKKLVKMAKEKVTNHVVRVKEIIRDAQTYNMDLDTFVEHATNVTNNNEVKNESEEV